MDIFEPEGEEADKRIGKEYIPDITVRVRMVNINYGRNKEMLNACKPLEEYAWLIQRIRDYRKQKEEIEDVLEMPDQINSYIVLHEKISYTFKEV